MVKVFKEIAFKQRPVNSGRFFDAKNFTGTVVDIKKYNIVDLFSGAGGLSLGFKQTGRIHISAAAENNPNARKTYKRNFNVKRMYKDVRTINYSELTSEEGHIDILVGGPPCQGFSNANRQHTKLISMNNRLVKEYVRAVCELSPSAFVMENVAMLQSERHRFMVEKKDLEDERILNNLQIKPERIELLEEDCLFFGALDLLENDPYFLLWADDLYKKINLLYRYRINQPKFDNSLKKHRKQLIPMLDEISSSVLENGYYLAKKLTKDMAEAVLRYDKTHDNFEGVINAIKKPLMLQNAIRRKKELEDNDIYVFKYKSDAGIYAEVKSYSVLDYIEGILSKPPNDYALYKQVFNSIDFGAPQRRERFIIIGTKKKYGEPHPEYASNGLSHQTVRDAIGDLQNVPPFTELTDEGIPLSPRSNAGDLEKMLRGRILYNHITTNTRPTAMARFKALKEGENFHDLDPALKATYSNAERTQNTIYMRLRYDEPCGTVVNIRKSMWIHPELDRAVSIREAARLQTFPDTFIFEGTKDSQYQQVGNAVPPFLARAIAESIIKVLDEAKDMPPSN